MNRSSAIVALFAVAVAACTSVAPAPADSPPAASSAASFSLAPVGTLAPVAQASAATLPTLAPAASLVPSATATPPATPTATPTATRTSKPTPTRTATATPTPTPTTAAPRIKTFVGPEGDINCNVDTPPSTVHLEWSLVRAAGAALSIDGAGIYDSYAGIGGDADVPFACGEPEHTYTLETIGADPPARKKLVVRRATPIIDEFHGTLVVSPQPCVDHSIKLFYRVFNATGASISSGGQVLGNYDGETGSVDVMFKCGTTNSQTYTLTTIAPYGPQATVDTTVTYVQSQP
jgi:hypothetical protein